MSAAEHLVDNQRDKEREKIEAKLESLKLKIVDVAPNGDCLFASVADQLQKVLGIESNVGAMRLQAAEIMKANVGDYIPFMEEEMNRDQFLAYCHKMETTHEWGGQVEIQALCQALNVPIRVIQADGPDVVSDPANKSNEKPLVITFHRHEFGLGEHYNSTESAQ